eukprot:scaffold310568_cov12-Tisochrysis_lutea.AAC.1
MTFCLPAQAIASNASSLLASADFSFLFEYATYRSKIGLWGFLLVYLHLKCWDLYESQDGTSGLNAPML